jgi:hypothetical protein
MLEQDVFNLDIMSENPHDHYSIVDVGQIWGDWQLTPLRVVRL